METRKNLSIFVVALLALSLFITPAGLRAQTQTVRTYTEKVLYNFIGGANDGLAPWGGVYRDSAGTLYGTTYSGGLTSGCLIGNGCGTIYKVDSAGNETVLHFFTGGSDGGGPIGSLVSDGAGNFYGTTSGGGDSSCLCGVVYKLDTAGVLTVLHAFTDAPPDNYFGPTAGVVRDKAGNLYGSTWDGGNYQLGSAFKIDSSGNYTLLHSFNVWDGLWGYLGPVTLDSAGNLYGTTSYGGSGGSGTVYAMNSAGVETVLYSFTGGKDGAFPTGGVSRDRFGNLYGVTYEGGSAFGLNGAGVVYKISKTGRFSLLYTFPAGGHGGSYGGGVLIDKSANLYGTTSFDGAYSRGSVFEIDNTGIETDLYSFTGGADGDSAWGTLIRDSSGNLYGTTQYGGATGGGVVFELIPN